MDKRDEMTLAEQTARRLLLAGIKPDDPGLVAIRDWNAGIGDTDGSRTQGTAPLNLPPMPRPYPGRPASQRRHR